MGEFGYETLDVYLCVMDFLVAAILLTDKLLKGFAHVGVQLKRASLSVPRNISEGSGKSSPQERGRFFEIARSSALECSAIVIGPRTLSLADRSLLDQNRALIFRIVQMFSKCT
jgi:four helix bundle protein